MYFKPVSYCPDDDDAELRELNRRLREAQKAARKREIEKQIRDLTGGLWV